MPPHKTAKGGKLGHFSNICEESITSDEAMKWQFEHSKDVGGPKGGPPNRSTDGRGAWQISESGPEVTPGCYSRN
jgi:hypothetical protein